MKCLTPARIGAMQLKNRFIFPSMCHFYCDSEGFVTPQLKAYVRARAEGGAAAIILPGSPHGKPGPARAALSAPAYYAGWSELAQICHAQDCRLIVQIHPAKAQAGRDPSLLLPDNMPLEMICEIVDSYAACARAARRVGADGVEIHGAHAHEVAQFMSPYYNHRTDAYGGSVAGRARLGMEVVAAIKREAGSDFPVIFRISAEELIPGGRELEETIRIAQMLETAGADALHVSIGMPLSEAYISAPMDVEDGFNVGRIARVHEAVRIPVIAVNRINTPALAEQIIARGDADFVAVGRGMLADPAFVNKIRTGEPLRMCLGCNQGCRKSLTKKAIYCVQNPMTGREATLRIEADHALDGKRVLVVGAGVAGLEAAMDLAIRGAQVEVWERGERAGGLLQLACIPPHKSVMARMIDYRLAMLERLGVPVRCGVEATAESVLAWRADWVVAATGSEPAMPPVTGLETAVSADWALAHLAALQGKRVAVLGGGLVGLETADALCAAGAQAEIFEQGETVGAGLNANRMFFIRRRLEAAGCSVHCGVRVEAVSGGRVICTHAQERREAGPFDAVVAALGRRSRRTLVDALREVCPDVRVTVLGDALQPGTAMEATARAAQFAAAAGAENA